VTGVRKNSLRKGNIAPRVLNPFGAFFQLCVKRTPFFREMALREWVIAHIV